MPGSNNIGESAPFTRPGVVSRISKDITNVAKNIYLNFHHSGCLPQFGVLMSVGTSSKSDALGETIVASEEVPRPDGCYRLYLCMLLSQQSGDRMWSEQTLCNIVQIRRG